MRRLPNSYYFWEGTIYLLVSKRVAEENGEWIDNILSTSRYIDESFSCECKTIFFTILLSQHRVGIF